MTLKEFRALLHGADGDATILFRLDDNLFECTGVMHLNDADGGKTVQVTLTEWGVVSDLKDAPDA